MSKHPIVIGLTGEYGAGKDTIGDYLDIHRGFAPDSFDAPIWHALNAIGLRWWQYSEKDAVIPPLRKSPRQLADSLRDDWGLELISRNMWTDLLLQRVQSFQLRHLPVVITDVATVEQEHVVRWRLGGQIWRVTRPGWSPPGGRKETAIQPLARVSAEIEIVNSGTVEQLFEQVDAALIQQYGSLIVAEELDDVAW